MIESILERVTHIHYRVPWLTHEHRLGHHKSQLRGGGLEFDQIKEHQTGEPIRRVNWTATARHGSSALYVNTYYDDKDMMVMLLVDLSASMDFGSTRVTKKHVAAEICASLAYSALDARDRIGMLGFTSDVACYLPPRHTRSYQWHIPEFIIQFDSTKTSADFLQAACSLEHYLKRRALVFVISDYLTEDFDSLTEAFGTLRNRHHVVSIQIRDTREVELPTGRAHIVTRDLETGQRSTYNFTRRNRERMRARIHAHQEQLHTMMQQLDVAQVTVMPDSNYSDAISQAFLTSRTRRKQQ